MELEYFFKDAPIKLLNDMNNNVWFIGKEIAKILGYKDTNQAIRKHIDDEDKVELLQILNPVEMTGFVGNEKSTICINESGLYSLILRSKLPEAKLFKRWVTNEVLPSIRKTSAYNLKEQLQIQHEQLSLEFEKKLSIASEKAEHECQLRQKREKQLELERQEKKLLEEHLIRYNKFEKNDLLYVVTNKTDAKNNIFKVGKTTKKNMTNRLAQYNTGSSEECYYIYLQEVFDAKLLERSVSYFLDKYKLPIPFEDKEKQSEEIYKIHFDDLLFILDCLAVNHQNVGSFINKNHKKLVEKSITKRSNPSKVKTWKEINMSEFKEDDMHEFRPSASHNSSNVRSTVSSLDEEIDDDIADWLSCNIKYTEDEKDYLIVKEIRQKYWLERKRTKLKEFDQILKRILEMNGRKIISQVKINGKNESNVIKYIRFEKEE